MARALLDLRQPSSDPGRTGPLLGTDPAIFVPDPDPTVRSDPLAADQSDDSTGGDSDPDSDSKSSSSSFGGIGLLLLATLALAARMRRRAARPYRAGTRADCPDA